MTADIEWPKYNIGPKEHIHALGVISLNYNLFEGALWLIFDQYLGIDGPFFFELLNNTERVGAMQQILHREHDPEVRDRIIYLAKYFSVCNENRNNLMHAQHNFGSSIADRLVVHKKSKKKTPMEFSMNLGTLRQIADDIHTGTVFLISIDKYLHSRKMHADPETTADYKNINPRGELPSIPKMPKKLESLGPVKLSS